jgi:hypothetical protein
MAGTQLADTHNFRQASSQLITAGQPNEAQLADAAQTHVHRT